MLCVVLCCVYCVCVGVCFMCVGVRACVSDCVGCVWLFVVCMVRVLNV